MSGFSDDAERKLDMQCSVCYHEGEDVQEALSGVGRSPALLCEFCRNTSAGNIAVYPFNFSPEAKQTARLIAELYWMLKGK